MKTFLASDTIALKCFNNYKYKAILIFFLLIPFMVFEISYDVHKHHASFFTFFLVILAVFFLGLYMRTVFNGIKLMNMILKKVEIDGSHVVFETFGTTMLFNLIERAPFVMDAQRNQTTCSLSTIKYGFGRKYTGDIYLLVYANDEYLIPVKFFEKFSELKATIDNQY